MKVRLHFAFTVALCVVIVPKIAWGHMKEGSHCFFRDGTLGACRKSSDCLELNGMLKETTETVRLCSRIELTYCCTKSIAHWKHAVRYTNSVPVHKYVPETRPVRSNGPVPAQGILPAREIRPALTRWHVLDKRQVRSGAPAPVWHVVPARGSHGAPAGWHVRDNNQMSSGGPTPARDVIPLRGSHVYPVSHNSNSPDPQRRSTRLGNNNRAWVHSPENQDNRSCVTDNGEIGVCTNRYQCPKLRTTAVISTQCSNGQTNSLICCPRMTSPVDTIPQTRTGQKRPAGEKSAAMCHEYAKYLIQKIRSPVMLVNPVYYNESMCMARKHAPNQRPLPDSEHVLEREYPHMAAVGYGEKDNIEWLCAGSLISESFILTTAHCLSSPSKKNVSWVHLGDTSVRNNPYKSHTSIQVADTFRHEEADIGLLKLERNVTIGTGIRPVCLYSKQGNPPGYKFATSTGWGKYDWDFEPLSTDLKKKDLNFEDCAQAEQRLGVNQRTHVCVSNPDVDDKSSCVVDSGSPLQIVIDEPDCMNSVLGLATWGTDACTDNGNIAKYTRVSTYIQWIEDIVWPE